MLNILVVLPVVSLLAFGFFSIRNAVRAKKSDDIRMQDLPPWMISCDELQQDIYS